jgi:hypothetical protein
LILRVNFVSGAEESSGFRFTGSEGVMTVGKNVTISVPAKALEPGYSIETFAEAEQQAFLKRYHQQYPNVRPTAATMKTSRNEVFEAPPDYSDHFDHHTSFALAVRSRKPAVEDAVFGFRAAGPALLSNISYFEKRMVEWDPATMKMSA